MFSSPLHYGMSPHPLYALNSPYQHVGPGFASTTPYNTAGLCFTNGFQGESATANLLQATCV